MSSASRLAALAPGLGQPLSRRVADDLIDRIKQGEYRPGNALPPVHELMRVYGVGRNTVREAMQALMALGLVDVRPRRGATVLTMSAGQVLPSATLSALLDGTAVTDLYEVRMLIEVEAAGRAAHHRTGPQLDAIKHALTHFQLAHKTGAPAWAADVEFHYAIAAASGNTALPRILEAMSDLLSDSRRATQDVPGAVALAVVEHSAIAEAIEAHDERRARRRMEQHIESAMWALNTLMETGRGGGQAGERAEAATKPGRRKQPAPPGPGPRRRPPIRKDAD